MLLLVWPLTYRYTSLGVDSEEMVGQSVHGRYYRVRWPGNGSLMGGYVDSHHHFRVDKPADAFDLGGTFLQPAKAPPPRSVAVGVAHSQRTAAVGGELAGVLVDRL